MTHARGRLARLAAGLGATIIGLGLVAVGTAPSASAADNGSWSVAPAKKGSAEARAAFVFDVGAGITIRDQVTIANQTGEPLTLELYPADAYNAQGGGGFALRQQSEPREGVGAWVRLSKSRVTVPANGSVTVPFSLVVPQSATPGDHVGGIVALNTEDEGTQSADGVTLGVRRAVGTRIYSRVSGPLTPALSVTNVTVDTLEKAQVPLLQAGKATISYTIVNSGNTRMTATQAMTVTGLFGQVLYQPVLAATPEILPGQQVTLVQAWDAVPAFNQAHVRVELAATDVSGAEVVAAGDATVWYVPWLFLLAITAIVVLVLVWRRLRRRPRTTASASDTGTPFPNLAPTSQGGARQRGTHRRD